ncbi:MAG TPA: rubredoxin [Nitrospirota bacterium]|nr:rubredoxin [Nitrospirota bacterium]
MIWRCSLCGYIYDEVPNGEKIENLPDDWLCSVCNVSKNVS